VRDAVVMNSDSRQYERVTLADVAAKAGVSETTASHALTGRRHVAVATKARVQLAAKELNYRPNQVARSLRVKSTSTVAFIVNDIGNVSLTTSIRGASALFRQRGYAIDMVDSPEDGPTLEIVQQVLDRQPTGVVLFGEEPSKRAGDRLYAFGVPFVVGGLGAPHSGPCDVVYTDQQEAVDRVTRRLALGVEGRVCFLGGDVDDEGARARLNGFLAGMSAVGRQAEHDDVRLVPYSIDGGARAMAELIDDPPALIVAGSDQIAQGAMITASRAGIRIPEDLRIVGFDNIESCRVTTPPLSSIDVGLVGQGILCAQLLLDRIEGEFSGPPRVIRVDAEFIERESTR
jgi:LacI family transcriptional regulator